MTRYYKYSRKDEEWIMRDDPENKGLHAIDEEGRDYIRALHRLIDEMRIDLKKIADGFTFCDSVTGQTCDDVASHSLGLFETVDHE